MIYLMTMEKSKACGADKACFWMLAERVVLPVVWFEIKMINSLCYLIRHILY